MPQECGPIGAQPEAAAGVHQGAEDVRTAGRKGPLARHQPELRAVEADEAALRAQPQVAVLALGDRVDAAARKAVLGAPALALVACQRTSGIERLGRARCREGGERQRDPRAARCHGRNSNDWTTTSIGSGSVEVGDPNT